MEQLATYCSGVFLEGIYRKIDRPLSEILQSDNKSLWIADLYNFIHGRCTLITDLSIEEIIRRSTDEKASDYNPNFRRFWKNGRILIVSDPEIFARMIIDDTFFNDKTNEIFLLSSDMDFCKRVETDHGLLCSCPKDMDYKLPRFFIFEIKPIKKGGKIKSWDFLNLFRYPSNSAIIADNYILQQQSFLENNIFRILRNILPEQLNETYDLTIFTREVTDLDKKYDYLNEYLAKNFSFKTNLSIGLVSIGSLAIHDRDILTNYCWYHCGAGFNLFNHSGKDVRITNNTTLFIYPITNMGHNNSTIELDDENGTAVQTSYYNALEIYKRIWKELPDKLVSCQSLIDG